MSSVQNIAKNGTIRVYYKSSSFATGLNVRFEFYNLSGQTIVNQPADSEISGRGVYYYDFSAPNEDTYIVGKAYVDGNIDVEPIVFKIGNPASQLLFYYTEKILLRSLTYRIYNILGEIIQEDILTEVGSTNFYYATFTPTFAFSQTDNSYFFEVDDTYTTQPFVTAAGNYTGIGQIESININLQSPTLIAEMLYADNASVVAAQIINPSFSADALVTVSVFDGFTTIEPPEAIISTTIEASTPSVTSDILQPQASGDAIVVVAGFDGNTNIPLPTVPGQFIAEVEELDFNVGQPVVSTGVLITVVIKPHKTIAGDFEKQDSHDAEINDISVTVNQPTIVVETNSTQDQNGYSFDDHLSLGAAPGIPLGVGAKKWPFITIQFKISSQNFAYEEGIYHKKSGLESDIKVDVNNVKHKPKKVRFKMLEMARSSCDDEPKIKFHELKKA